MPVYIEIEAGKKTPHTRTMRSKDRHRKALGTKAASADRYSLIGGM